MSEESLTETSERRLIITCLMASLYFQNLDQIRSNIRDPKPIFTSSLLSDNKWIDVLY